MKKIVVAFNNKRDFYQIPIALCESGKLESFYTDTYCPDFIYNSFKKFSSFKKFGKILCGRYDERLSSSHVKSVGLFDEITYKIFEFLGKRVDHPYRNKKTNYKATLHAINTNSDLFIYSYGWQGVDEALKNFNKDINIIVFQVHPLTSQVKSALKNRPINFRKEYEENLSDADERSYIRFLSKNNCKIICASNYVRDGMVSAGLCKDDVNVIPYGFKDDRLNFCDQRNHAEQIFVKSDTQHSLNLVFCGSVIYRKGLSFLVKALNSLKRDDIHLTIITRYMPDTKLFSDLSNMTVLTNLSDSDVMLEMEKADLFVLPSLCEGFGLVYVEALSQGTPVICTKNTGIADFIENGSNGFIVEPENTEQLANIILQCANKVISTDSMKASCLKLSNSRSWFEFRSSILEILH